MIPPHSDILYLSNSPGRILHSFRPRVGIGIDVYRKSIEADKRRYPDLIFYNKRIVDLNLKNKFDFVIIDDIFHYIDDVFMTLKKLRTLCKDDAKIIISKVPEITLLKSIFNLFKRRDGKQKNWIPKQLLYALLFLSDFWPRPNIDSCVIADTIEMKRKKRYSYSIIIPAYNEEGNIVQCVNRVPDLKRDYEIIVINDGSKDRTADKVKELMKNNSHLRLIDYKLNRGKGYATRTGLDAAKKDVLMILDADMTVRPEDLFLFMEPFESGNAEFVNGTRMVYPMANQAMRSVNIFGNKIFSIIFSYLLSQNVTDTLCGTKCIFRKDYHRIIMEDNAWPDFDLLFGASKKYLKIVEVPIQYQNRVSGESKMKVVKHGFMLLKASVRGFFELRLSQ